MTKSRPRGKQTAAAPSPGPLARKLGPDERVTLAYLLGYTNLGSTYKVVGTELRFEYGGTVEMTDIFRLRKAVTTSLNSMAEDDEMYSGMMGEINDWINDKELSNCTLERIVKIWPDLKPIIVEWAKATR